MLQSCMHPVSAYNRRYARRIDGYVGVGRRWAADARSGRWEEGRMMVRPVNQEEEGMGQ